MMWNSSYDFQKKPYGTGIHGPGQFDSAIYDSDDFRMFQFKIKRCPRTTSHDWTKCPFAHRGEKAARRDPKRFPYCALPCAQFRNWGVCISGEACLFSHGVFEQWLHPDRYRSKLCTAGENCRRQVCFFAHKMNELRHSNHPKNKVPGEAVYQSHNWARAPEFVPRGRINAQPRPRPTPVARPVWQTSTQGSMQARAVPFAAPANAFNRGGTGNDFLASLSGLRVTQKEDNKGKSPIGSEELDNLDLSWYEELIMD